MIAKDFNNYLIITIKEYCEYITHKFLHNSDDKKVR